MFFSLGVRLTITASTNNSARAYRSALTDVLWSGWSSRRHRGAYRYGSGLVFRHPPHPSHGTPTRQCHRHISYAHACISSYYNRYVYVLMIITTKKLHIGNTAAHISTIEVQKSLLRNNIFMCYTAV